MTQNITEPKSEIRSDQWQVMCIAVGGSGVAAAARRPCAQCDLDLSGGGEFCCRTLVLTVAKQKS